MREETFEQWYMETTSQHWDMRNNWVGSARRRITKFRVNIEEDLNMLMKMRKR